MSFFHVSKQCIWCVRVLVWHERQHSTVTPILPSSHRRNSIVTRVLNVDEANFEQEVLKVWKGSRASVRVCIRFLVCTHQQLTCQDCVTHTLSCTSSNAG